MQCPYCGVGLPDGAPSCTSCRAVLVTSCRHCGAQTGILARECGSCGQRIGPEPRPAAAAPPPVPPPAVRPVPEDRNVVLTAILTIVTCHIWYFVALYQIAEDVNLHRGRRVLSPLLDILLIFLTCGLWAFYVMYRYPTEIREMLREEREQTSDLALACILLSFVGLWIIPPIILQNELNRHWARHRGAPAAA